MIRKLAFLSGSLLLGVAGLFVASSHGLSELTGHLAECRKQLADANVPGRVARIILGGLHNRRRRCQHAQRMAEDLYDYRVA